MADCVVIGLRQYGQNGRWKPRFGISTRRTGGLGLYSRLAIVTLAVCACAVSADAAESKTAIVAIGTVLGAAEEGMAVMSHCRAVDPASKDTYDGLALRLFALYRSYYERADQILPTEGIKAGYPDGNRFRGAFLAGLRETAQTEVRDLAATLTPAQDMASCRSQRDDFQQNKGLFAAPTARFPAEARIVDEWR